jgi:hypothetical protein
VGHYTRLAVVAFRVFGLIILFYAVPITLIGVVRVANGTALRDRNPEPGTMVAWAAYTLAGLLFVVLARPLGRFAARGLDAPEPSAPAA